MDVRSRLDINKGRQAMADRHRGAGSGFWACWVLSPGLSLVPKIRVEFTCVFESQTLQMVTWGS